MKGVGPDGQRLRPPPKARTAAEEDAREEAAVRAYREAHPYASASEVEEERAQARCRAGQVKVPYFDLTISAVKSVSVLHASLKVAAGRTGDAELAARLNELADGIEQDLMDSARAAIAYAEERAAFVRTGHHSATTGEWRDALGLVAALFLHHISRDGDPQLHVHAAIANLALRADGADDRWRGIYGRALHMMRLWIAARVDREMEARLIKRGLYMVPREDGNGSEVGGVSPQVAEMFSSRARGISPELDRLLEQYKQAHGREASARTRWLLGQQAAQNTRRAKARARQRAGGVDHGEDLDEAARLKAWEDQVTREELGALSQVWRDVEAFGAGKRHHSPEMEDLGRAARIAVAEVQKQHSVWSVAELAFEVNRALPPGASVGDIDIAVALAVTDSEVLEVAPAPDPVDTSSLGVRKDGTSVYRPPNEARYTTTGQLDLESRIMELARRKRPVMVTEAQAREAVARFGLDESQAEAVVTMLTSDGAVTLLTAPAGTGKTHTVSVFAQLWAELTGGRVIGLATSENAARVMAAEGLTAAYNIAAFLGKVKGSDELRYPIPIRAGDKLVLDESSQISTADLDLVLRFADRNGASLIPTGDPEQLGAVGAGGMFRALAEMLGSAELREIHRFAEAWEAKASLRLHDGDKTALAAYAARARLQGFDREAAMNRAAGAYLAGMLQGKDVLLLAGSNEEAAQLAARVQSGLIRLGLVQAPCTPLADGNQAGTGDRLRARLNCAIEAGGRRLTNRDTVRVVGWKYGDAIAVRALPEGGWSDEFVISRDYLAQSAELAYAGNVHVSQGRTVDVSNLYVSDTLSRESFYVGMTRGREGNFAWTVTGETAPEGQKPYQQATPESVISGIMDRESRELTAHQEIVQAQEWAGGMGHVLQIWTAAVGETAREAITASLRAYLSPHEYERYLAEHQRFALDQSLRERQLTGQNIRELVASITSQPLDGARSVSAVLHGRLAGIPRIRRPETWTDRTPESAPEFAREAADLMDARTRELGERLMETPEPWLVSQLGMPPSPQESPVLRAEYAARAGKAAAYREAAGIDRQNQAVALEAHRDRPELEAMRREAILALEIQDEAEIMRGMAPGELEAQVLEGERAMANAPRDVSAKLRNAAQAQQDCWQQSVEAEVAGNEAEAEGARALAGLLGTEQARLEKAREAYEDWEGRTAQARDLAAKARKELERRGTLEEVTAEPAESTAAWYAEFSAQADAVEAAIEREREAAAEAGTPWPPEREEPEPAPVVPEDPSPEPEMA